MLNPKIKIKGDTLSISRGSKRLIVHMDDIQEVYVDKRKLGNPHVAISTGGRTVRFKCLTVDKAMMLVHQIRQASGRNVSYQIERPV